MNHQLKPDIYDASIELNTIGEEIRSIAEIHQKNIENLESLLSIELSDQCTKLTNPQIKRISDYIGVAGLDNYIRNFQDNYKATVSRCKEEYKQSKLKFRAFKDVLSILGPEYNSNIDKLNDVLDFFDKDSIEEVFELEVVNHALFKSNQGNDINHVNLSALLRKGILAAESQETPIYNEQKLINWIEKKEWVNSISDPKYLLSLADVYRDFGVTLVFVPYLQKTVYGIVHWLEDRPIIVITDRGRDLACCWGTLFHEIGHLINDKGCSIFEYEECSSMKKRELAEIEKNANDFANQYLLNNIDLRRAVFAAKSKGQNLTWTDINMRYGIHKIFAQYWLRKANIEPWKNRAISIDFNDFI